MISPIQAATAGAAVAWVVALVAAPALMVPVAGILYAAGSLLCHQLPDRSFHVGGYQLPVCGRCLGLYAGAAAGSIAAVLAAAQPILRRGVASGRGASRQRRRRGHSEPRLTLAWRATVAAAVPTAVTFVAEWGAGWALTNGARAAAAFPFGAVVAFVVVGALATVDYGECAPRRPWAHGQPPSTSI